MKTQTTQENSITQSNLPQKKSTSHFRECEKIKTLGNKTLVFVSFKTKQQVDRILPIISKLTDSIHTYSHQIGYSLSFPYTDEVYFNYLVAKTCMAV